MKKNQIRLLTIIVFNLQLGSSFAQTRYIDEVFNYVQKTSNIEYDSNVSVNLFYGMGSLPPALTTQFYTAKLLCDFYEPVQDVIVAKRPLIILVHTGSFLPIILNKQPTGSKNDSSIVTLANSFARRGYVVAAIDCRLGWNPATTVQKFADQQMLQALLRGMQDVRNAVRYFRSHANTYRVDTSKIIVGGQGTGGYVALAIGTLSKRADFETNPKFLKGDSTPMVNIDTLGDWNGLGGLVPYVYSGDPSLSSDVHMVFNSGGALLDTAWMKSVGLPVVSLQCVNDPFAPFHTGIIDPNLGISLFSSASGAGDVIPKANKMGINNKINSLRYLDPYSYRALEVTPAQNNIFGFQTSFPFESAPWEYWDRPTVQAVTSVLYRTVSVPANGREADSLSMLTNPFMSDTRGKKYCDTLVKFVAPRIAVQFDLTGDVTLNSFNLLSPLSGSNITVRDTILPVVLKWQHSNVPQAAPAATQYYWMVDIDTGDFTSPLNIVPAGDNDSLVLSEKEIFDGLTDLGVGVGQTTTLKWTVSAENDYFGRYSNTPFYINVTKAGPLSGIQEFDLSSFLSIIPNPALTHIRVILNSGKEAINELLIMDITGRTVAAFEELNTFNQTVSVSGLGSGIYFVNVKATNGATATKRFIIQL
ncbi:MAG: T9SS type A sorting domain-containing protein [Bacteroidota bacterium]|nr:T9SS type A sorting domain-containing protein [Bacteroidota bacterium]